MSEIKTSDMITRTLYSAAVGGANVRVYKSDKGQIINYDTQVVYLAEAVKIIECIEDTLNPNQNER